MQRVFFALIFFLISLGSSPSVLARPHTFYQAQQVFERALPLGERLTIQVLLIAAGYTNAVPTAGFSTRTFQAIQRFQADAGYESNGILAPAQVTRLLELGMPLLNSWGFQKVVHPYRPVALWIPLGIGLTVGQNASGLHYRDPRERLFVDFVSVPNKALEGVMDEIAQSSRKSGAIVHFAINKDGWFVVSSTTSDGADHYYRYHQDGTSVTGFALEWRNANGDLHGERIAVLMSASLGSAMGGPPLIEPPAAQLAKANPQPEPFSPPEVAPPLPPTQPVQKKISVGTGFFVNSDGYLVTNAHVVDGCEKIIAKTDDGAVLDADRRATDATNDLALLKVRRASTKAAPLKLTPRLGEGVEAFGYPHPELLSSSGNFTLGNITALNGLGDDSRYLQISAPVQSGNSGGPLLDQYGNVVGVVSMKLNAIRVAVKDGDLPQNVNFALKTTMLSSFLDVNRVSYEANQKSGRSMQPADLADLAREMSVFIVCQ